MGINKKRYENLLERQAAQHSLLWDGITPEYLLKEKDNPKLPKISEKELDLFEDPFSEE